MVVLCINVTGAYLLFLRRACRWFHHEKKYRPLEHHSFGRSRCTYRISLAKRKWSPWLSKNNTPFRCSPRHFCTPLFPHSHHQQSPLELTYPLPLTPYPFMPDQPDSSKDANVFQKSMEEAMARLDKVNEEVLKAKEKAIDQEIAAKEELRSIQLNAEKLSEEFYNAHQKEYDRRIRNDTLMDVTEKLLGAGLPSQEVKRWLDVSDEVIAHAHTYLKFEKLGDRMAVVYFDNKGRAGDVYFNWDGIVIKFPFEFAGGNALATIDVPSADHWLRETGIPIEQRMMVLEFVAQRIIRSQAPDHKYEIKDDYIRIYN